MINKIEQQNIKQQRIDDFLTFYTNSMFVKDIDPNIWLSKYIIDRMELNDEQILWFCFLCSITYQLPTAYLIINEYPDLELIDEHRLKEWWTQVQQRCPFQKDKLKQRKYLPETIMSYKNLVNGSQTKFFNDILTGTDTENFNYLWNVLYKNIAHFGRFSVWNWSQMLKQVALYNIEPDTLFLGESNSESHTHGLCYAIGKDEWAKKIRYKDGEKRKKEVHNFTKDEKILLESEAEYILEKLLESDIDVDRFYIETVACAYKKLFRNNDSRYVGYYLDRQAEDIIKLERENWYGVDWKLLWDARRELLNKNHLHTKVDTRKFSLPYEEKIQLPKEMKCNMIQSILHGDLK